MSDSPEISAERLKVILGAEQVLGSHIAGDLPCTKVTDLSSGEERTIETPVHIFSFGGAAVRLPLFKLSLIVMLAGAAFSFDYDLTDRHLPELPDVVPETYHAAAEEESVEDAESNLLPLADSGSVAEVVPAFSGAVLEPVAPVQEEIRGDNKTGVFLTASSIADRDFLLHTFDELLAASGSALVFDVKGASVLFHSAAPMANDIGLVKSIYELSEILALTKEKGLYTIGRFVAIKDAGITRKVPETRIKDPKTGKVLSQDWVDPSDETAIRYNMEVLCELAGSGIDEINLDYIRFSTAEFGALKVFSGQEKADRLEAFIRAARETIDRCGPKTKLGLSTFAILGWQYDQNVATLGQDVVRFAPLVDIISPMAYPATFSTNAYYNPRTDSGSRMYFLVHRTLTGYQELLGPEQSRKLRPWIQGYGVTKKNMQDQMKAVADAGVCGFTVWSANNAYGPTYAAMKVQSARPERCLP